MLTALTLTYLTLHLLAGLLLLGACQRAALTDRRAVCPYRPLLDRRSPSMLPPPGD